MNNDLYVVSLSAVIMCVVCNYTNIYVYYIYIRLNTTYRRPVMHIAPRTGDHCFKETGAGLLKVLMCNCITNAFYLIIILVTGNFLDIKELTYAIVINFILYFDWF